LLSELLPAPRPGVVEALFIDQGRSDEPLSAPAVSHSSTTLPLIRDALASLRLRSRRPGRLAATIATHMSFRMLRGSQRPSKGPMGTKISDGRYRPDSRALLLSLPSRTLSSSSRTRMQSNGKGLVGGLGQVRAPAFADRRRRRHRVSQLGLRRAGGRL
jgi:hypothetical protein